MQPDVLYLVEYSQYSCKSCLFPRGHLVELQSATVPPLYESAGWLVKRYGSGRPQTHLTKCLAVATREL